MQSAECGLCGGATAQLIHILTHLPLCPPPPPRAGSPLPSFLLSKRVLQLDVGLLVAGAKERGELENRVTRLLAEARECGNVVLMWVAVGLPWVGLLACPSTGCSCGWL